MTVNTPATIFLFVGIIVLALAVIAMAIWVASLSGRVRRLSDRLMYDATAQPATRSTVHQTRQSPAVTGSYMQQPAMQGPGATQPFNAGGQTVISAQPAVARMWTNAVQPMQEPDDGQSFFDSYRMQSEGHQTGAFGRTKPSIPFGEDQSAIARREEYTQEAISGDFDPDSIDFSRVAGYRNLRHQ